MSGNLICKNNPQLFSFFRFIDNLHNHKSPSRPPGFSLRARAGPGLGPSIKTGLGPSKKGRARVGLGPGLGPDPSLMQDEHGLDYLHFTQMDKPKCQFSK